MDLEAYFSKEIDMVSNDIKNEDLGLETDLKLRDRYLLERDRIKQQIGNLRQILEALGVNQRRACQLLLVDPSAWTRWNKTEAPPHIYQALKWLVMLKTSNPSLVGSTDIEHRIDLVQSSTQNKLKELERNVASLERALTYQPVANSTPNEQSRIAELFRLQEERLQKRISELEIEVKRLSEKPKTLRGSPSNLTRHKSKTRARKKLALKPKSRPRLLQKKVGKKIKSPQKRKSLLKLSRLRVKSRGSAKRKNSRILFKTKSRKKTKAYIR